MFTDINKKERMKALDNAVTDILFPAARLSVLLLFRNKDILNQLVVSDLLFNFRWNIRLKDVQNSLKLNTE